MTRLNATAVVVVADVEHMENDVFREEALVTALFALRMPSATELEVRAKVNSLSMAVEDLVRAFLSEAA